MFDSLSYEEQLGRFTQAAEQLVPAFGLQDFDVTPLSYIGNAVFAVDCRRGPYVLRIHRPGHLPAAYIASEMRWLHDLNAQTDLCVPQPLLTRAGEWLAWAAVEGLPNALPAVLFAWLEGNRPPTLTPDHLHQVGGFLARLHHFSARYTPPADFVRPRLDWEGLFGADSPYDPGDGAQLFTPDQVAMMEAVAEQVRAVMHRLDRDPNSFGLIHGDFIAKNTLFADGTICALDFEYCAWGYYLYELAPVLLGLSPLPDYITLKEALWTGYTAQRPLPAAYRDDLETLVAGRHVASCRWIASNLDNPKIRARAPQILAHRTEELRHFLATGRLERKSEIF
jgi:Ser/Thr protein kinase RdoA (MazF antagonist)